MPGFDNLAQVLPGCNIKDAAFNSSHACNVSSVAFSIFSSDNSKSGSFSLPGTTLQTNLFHDSFSCPQSGDVPALNGSVSVDLKNTVTGSINYAVSYKSIFGVPNPLSVDFAVGFDAALDGTLSVHADLMVSLHARGQVWKLTAGWWDL